MRIETARLVLRDYCPEDMDTYYRMKTDPTVWKDSTEQPVGHWGQAAKALGDILSALGGKVFQSGGTLAVELYLQMQNGEYEAAFGIGCVLILQALALNLLIKLICGGALRGRAGFWRRTGNRRSYLRRKGVLEKRGFLENGSGKDIGERPEAFL